MTQKLAKRFSLSSFAICLLLLAGCGSAERGLSANGREVALGERFKLEKDEKVWVKGAALTVQLKGVRRTWYVDGKSETADADIIITLDSKEQRQWMDIGEEVAIGDYIVKLRGADPFGKTNCELIVTRR